MNAIGGWQRFLVSLGLGVGLFVVTAFWVLLALVVLRPSRELGPLDCAPLGVAALALGCALVGFGLRAAKLPVVFLCDQLLALSTLFALRAVAHDEFYGGVLYLMIALLVTRTLVRADGVPSARAWAIALTGLLCGAQFYLPWPSERPAELAGSIAVATVVLALGARWRSADARQR